MFSARVRKSLSFVLTLTTALTLALSVSACGRGSSKNVKIDGVDGPRVNYVDGKLTMAVVLKNAQIDFGVRIPLPFSYARKHS